MRDFDKLLMICITIIVLALMGMLWKNCENQHDRRAKCMEHYSPAECKQAFPSPDNR